MASRPLLSWIAVAAVPIAYELYTVYNEADGDTLSEVVRATVHPDTQGGKVAFTLGWWSFVGAGGYWFWRHILDEHSVPCLSKYPRIR